MATITKNKKVGDLTTGELKAIIRDTIYELVDPDFGLKLRPETEEALRKSVSSEERIPAEKVAAELGLKW